MRILHVNDVSSVGSILTDASNGRDALFQPTLRKNVGSGVIGSARFAMGRAADVARLRRAATTTNDTIVHVHYATFAHLAELALLPFSLHVHGGDVRIDRRGVVRRFLVDRALGRASVVVVSTPDLIAPVRLLRPDARYIPNPMPLLPMRRQRDETSAPRLIVLSKMDYLKGWPRQLEILEALRAAIPNLEIHFFDRGQLPDGERRELAARASALGAQPLQVVPRAQFLELLASFDVALGQQEVGALGMSEMEAMSSGVPIIADVAAHRQAGYDPPVLPVDQPELLRDLLSNSAALAAAGKNGREYIRAVHDPSTVLAALTRAVYREQL
jgi:glycosyltransferase involved in cell wall biosynthesis